jgi:hypothetical protein
VLFGATDRQNREISVEITDLGPRRLRELHIGFEGRSGI